ncbi:hypothetical protein NEOC65_000460 [Neochlamydia sp. AcF65]|nr:hypothetical protein [Neochlamydia sp. AcF65]
MRLVASSSKRSSDATRINRSLSSEMDKRYSLRWMRSLLKNRSDLTKERLEMTRAKMDLHVKDCLVFDYEELIGNLKLPDPDDRHVLAAAIKANAQTIVTYNLTDFPPSAVAKYGIDA